MKLQHSARSIAMAGHTGAVQLVIDALRSDDPTHRATALGAASRLEILREENLRTALADPAPAVRRRAAELAPHTLAATCSPDAIDALVDLLADPPCAEVAAAALGELGDVLAPLPAVAATVVAALEKQATEHDDPLCRESAVAALGSLGEGLPAVLAATEDVATVRRRAVIALANFDGPTVEAALSRATSDRDWQVRQAAEDLLDQ